MFAEALGSVWRFTQTSRLFCTHWEHRVFFARLCRWNFALQGILIGRLAQGACRQQEHSGDSTYQRDHQPR